MHADLTKVRQVILNLLSNAGKFTNQGNVLLDVTRTLVDGSGLSRNDRLTPDLLARVLVLDAKGDRPALRSIYGGLPVAGYSGTLRDRYRKPTTGAAGAGQVRAKTGTLTPGVAAIAGIALDADGRALAFAVLVGIGDNAFPAEDALDRLAAVLAGCGCR